MQVIIDRIEGDMVVVELSSKSTISVPISLFPGAIEGDVYHISKNGDETANRGERIKGKFDKLKMQ